VESKKPTSSSRALSTIGAFWRDIRFLQALAQAVFLILVVVFARWLISNLLDNLDARGLSLSFSFLKRTAGFILGQGLPMERTDTFWFAYVVGVTNTLRAVIFGLLLATILGILAGIALISPNWLLRNIVQAYVEIMRNTPLLVQLFFLYSGVILALPILQEQLSLGPIILSNRGLFLPRPVPEAGFTIWIALVILGAILSLFIYSRLLQRRIRSGIETRPALWAALPLFGLPILSWILLPAPPLSIDLPKLEGPRMVGGMTMTPEFAGILFGLVIYTAAFIADIVRAGILAVPKGQTEAATATGLTKGQVLRLVILPQAMRVIIPPLTNQYLNLAKNSSLAIGVGYPDLYTASQEIFNQSGQAVQVIALMMTTYLLMSLLISAIMNFLNARLKIQER
jgi:general L-amino acid transport system permease protein